MKNGRAKWLGVVAHSLLAANAPVVHDIINNKEKLAVFKAWWQAGKKHKATDEVWWRGPKAFDDMNTTGVLSGTAAEAGRTGAGLKEWLTTIRTLCRTELARRKKMMRTTSPPKQNAL